MLNDEKIKVFISSKCGGERINFDKLVKNSSKNKGDIAEEAVKANYDLIRRALKLSLDQTGFITTYTFEDEPASTVPAQDDYLDQIDSCDVCLFLIDNFNEKIPPGVLKEITRAQKQQKKSIYIFLNHPDYEKTSIQLNLTGPNGGRYKEIQDIREFIDKGYESIVANIQQIYKMYCKGKLNIIEESISTIDVTQKNFPIDAVKIDKQTLKNFGLTIKKLLNLVYIPDVNNVQPSKLDEFCVAVLAVILGEKSFDDFNFRALVGTLNEIQSPILFEVVSQRWDAIAEIYKGNLDNAISTLTSIYNKYSKLAAIPDWLVNDILIDWRNLDIVNKQSKNTFDMSVQEIINQRDSPFYFPLADRSASDISEELLNRKFNTLTNPYSNTIYNSEWLFEYISTYLFVAIFYGSYTHITLTLKQIEKVLIDIVQRQNDLFHKINLMKISVLLGNEDDFKKIMYKYGASLSHSTTKEILDLYNLADKKPIQHYKTSWKLLLFKELGYYFSDKDYEIISNEILNLSRDLLNNENPNIFLIQKLIDALKGNKERFSQKEIIHFGIEVLAKKYYRYSDAIFEVLRQLDILAMPHELLQDLLSQIRLLVGDEKKVLQQDQNLKRLLIGIRKRREELSEEIDSLVEKYLPEFYQQDYHLEIFPGERTGHIQRYIEKIESRNKVQGKNGTFIGFTDQPYITIKNILEFDNISISEALCGSLLTEIYNTLLSEGQSYSEKINAIQLLFYLKHQSWTNNYDWSSFYSNFKKNIEEVQKGHSSLFEAEQPLLLKLHLVLLQTTFGDDTLRDLLEILALISSNSSEITGSLVALRDFLKVEKNNLEKSSLVPIIVQYVSSFCFHEDDTIRLFTVEALYPLLDTQYSSFVVSRLTKMVEDDAFKIKLAVLHQAYLVRSLSLPSFNYIIEKGKIDQNYLVRMLAERKAKQE